MKDKIALLKSLSGLTINLSAGWFGLALITPNFSVVAGIKELSLLLYDVTFGILFLWFSYKLEKMLKYCLTD